jgi:hypothetical protein
MQFNSRCCLRRDHGEGCPADLKGQRNQPKNQEEGCRWQGCPVRRSVHHAEGLRSPGYFPAGRRRLRAVPSR